MMFVEWEERNENSEVWVEAVSSLIPNVPIEERF